MNLIVLVFAALCSTIVLAADAVAPALPGWLGQVGTYVDLVCQVITVLMILATVVVRVVPGKGAAAQVSSLVGRVMKALSWLPTLGINPRTKALEAALVEAQKQLEEYKAKEAVDTPPPAAGNGQ